MIPSPLSSVTLDGRDFLIKRDDLIDPYLAGNKYRKLYTLIKTPKERYRKLVSYGGTQSNAMLALAALCKEKEWSFQYFTKPLSERQKGEASGNYALARSLGMEHYEIPHEYYKERVASLRFNLDESTIVVDQGGAAHLAKEGLEQLACEIKEINSDIRSVATPSGTGTTALYLALALPEYRVYTTPSVGDALYLKEQMRVLEMIPKNLIILEPEKKYPFGKPNREFYEIYQKLLACEIEFDLLYAPLMWKMLLEQTSEPILYIHSGGVSGNASMLERYKALI